MQNPTPQKILYDAISNLFYIRQHNKEYNVIYLEKSKANPKIVELSQENHIFYAQNLTTVINPNNKTDTEICYKRYKSKAIIFL